MNCVIQYKVSLREITHTKKDRYISTFIIFIRYISSIKNTETRLGRTYGVYATRLVGKGIRNRT